MENITLYAEVDENREMVVGITNMWLSVDNRYGCSKLCVKRVKPKMNE